MSNNTYSGILTSTDYQPPVQTKKITFQVQPFGDGYIISGEDFDMLMKEIGAAFTINEINDLSNE